MENLIIEAIKSCRQLKFSYHGHTRLVDPYTYGADQKGHSALLAYQVAGTSQSGRIPDWRIYHLSAIVDLSISATIFVPSQPTWQTRSKQFSRVIATLG